MALKHRKRWIRNIAAQQIERLFELAESISEARPLLCDRYVHIARRIGMRHRVRIPAHLKRRMCKHCGKYLVPGRTCRVRLNGTCVVVTCLSCGKQTRRPYHYDRNHTPDKERK
ncbi:MAG: ribonuclease P protein component 4 [Euryarchaeota archaeon]|nr:ribonuclease P protein component 4 [Euryarchaeota archaeon]